MYFHTLVLQRFKRYRVLLIITKLLMKGRLDTFFFFLRSQPPLRDKRRRGPACVGLSS